MSLSKMAHASSVGRACLLAWSFRRFPAVCIDMRRVPSLRASQTRPQLNQDVSVLTASWKSRPSSPETHNETAEALRVQTAAGYSLHPRRHDSDHACNKVARLETFAVEISQDQYHACLLLGSFCEVAWWSRRCEGIPLIGGYTWVLDSQPEEFQKMHEDWDFEGLNSSFWKFWVWFSRFWPSFKQYVGPNGLKLRIWPQKTANQVGYPGPS